MDGLHIETTGDTAGVDFEPTVTSMDGKILLPWLSLEDEYDSDPGVHVETTRG